MSNARFLFSLMTAGTLALGACGSKTPPKSTTTTKTQTEVTNDSGDKAVVETSKTTTEQPDGSQNVKTTETTNTTVPAKK